MKSSQCIIVFIDHNKKWLYKIETALKKKGYNFKGFTNLDDYKRTSMHWSKASLVFIDQSFAEAEPNQIRDIAKKDHRHITVLFSVDYVPWKMSKTFKLGIDDCIEKPVNINTMVRFVDFLNSESCEFENNSWEGFNSNHVLAF